MRYKQINNDKEVAEIELSATFFCFYDKGVEFVAQTIGSGAFLFFKQQEA